MKNTNSRFMKFIVVGIVPDVLLLKSVNVWAEEELSQEYITQIVCASYYANESKRAEDAGDTTSQDIYHEGFLVIHAYTKKKFKDIGEETIVSHTTTTLQNIMDQSEAEYQASKPELDTACQLVLEESLK